MPADLTVLQPTRRFTDRVDNYVKYRPSYPEEIVSFFEKEFGLSHEQRIADIGSGTGIFSELLLKKNYGVTCIEPNDEMRKAAERKLAEYTGFTSRNRRAEHTGLRTHSADLITVAQAFHWMEPVATKKEFLRILKPGGHIVLIWNVRNPASAFMHDHEALKQEFGIDYNAVARSDENAVRSFFEPAEVGQQNFPNTQQLDFEGLKGQLLSSSYIPLPGHPAYEKMIDTLIHLFVKYNDNGLIKMEYETRIYWNKG